MLDSPLFEPRKLRLFDIKTIKESLNVTTLDDSSVAEFVHKHVLNIGFNAEERGVKVDLILSVRAKEMPSREIESKLELTTSFFYELENFGELVAFDNDGNLSDVNEELLAALASVSFSTFRGILFTKTQNTPFSKFILPVLSIKDLMSAPE